MKVALELQPCCGNRSGIGVYTYELAHRMKDQDGLEFCGNLFNFMGRNDNSQALKGITMPVRVNHFSYGVYRRVWNAAPIPYKIMFPGHMDLSVFFNYIVPPRIEGKVMTTVYDLTYLRYPETMDKKNLRRIRKGIQYSIRRSSRILTISEFSKRELMELLDIPEEKISVVYTAPSLTPESADFEEICRKYGISGSYILYIGTIEPRKNLVRLLKAFDLLKSREGIPHRLVLAGGRGWQDGEIMDTVKAIKHAGDVVFTGYVSAEEKNTLYQKAEAFVFPSLYEGFGIPPLEAMIWGCPVVCADTASLPEAVGDGAELVDPLEVESIAAGVLRVLTDKAYAAKLVERGRRHAAKFTWEESAEKLTQICKEVLEVS